MPSLNTTDYVMATTNIGIELYIHQQSGEVFASQRMLVRLVEKDEFIIRSWKGVGKASVKMAEIPTAGGL